MDLDLLPMFAVFAETLSFTETGRRCGLTQPAVHGQVKRLERAVGPLYRREGRGVVLTPRGGSLAALARRVVAERDAFLSARPVVRTLAAGRGAWTDWLVESLGPWIREHGIRPVVADGATALSGVWEGRFDYGVATVRDERLRSAALRSVGTNLVVASDHPLASRETVRVAELDGLTWVAPSEGRPHRIAMETLLRRVDCTFEVAAVADDWHVQLRFVALGCGCAAVNDTVRAPGLVSVPIVDGPRQTYWLLWRDGTYSSHSPGSGARASRMPS